MAVGGTTLNITTSGGTTTYVSESAWSNAYGGSSGGLSAYEAKPAYQDAVNSASTRSVPDVAFDADPNTGVSVYYIAPTAKNATASSGTWLVVGGTSLGAPAWAAIIALADQSLIQANAASLSSTQSLNALYAIASVSPADFHSVTPAALTSESGLGFRGRFTGAQSLPDDFTGLGSPVGASLLAGVVDEAEGKAAPANPGAPPSTFNGQNVPTPTKPAGGTNPNNGGQGGAKQNAGWWWWFGWSPSNRGTNAALGGLFSAPGGSPSWPGLMAGVPSKPSTVAFAAAPSRLPIAPAVVVGSHPWGPTPLGASSGLIGSVGLLTPVFTPDLAALVPLQNVPNLGPRIDQSLASYESRYLAW